MYENRHITEPKWKSWIVQTTTPLFTPDQCRQIIECGRRQPPQQAQVGMGKPGGGTDTKKRVTRSDFKYFKGKFYLLEINTQPGMTKLSLVPEISAYIGINFINLIKLILKDASINK